MSQQVYQSTYLDDDIGGGGGGGTVISESFYRVRVIIKDVTPEQGIPNASVIYDETNGYFEFTDSQGYATWTSDIPMYMNVRITAPGYEDGSIHKLTPKTGSQYQKTSLTPLASSYYYKLIVRDQNSSPIEGVKVKILDTNNNVIDDDSHFATSSDGSFVYNSDTADTIRFRLEKNGFRPATTNSILGLSSMIDAESAPLIYRMSTVSEADYYYTLLAKDNTGNPVKNMGVRFYTDFSAVTPYVDEVKSTNNNGRITLENGRSSSAPQRIYAKCTTLPDGYALTVSPDIPITVSPNTDAAIVGGTFTLQSMVVSTKYYYHFKIYDEVSQIPLDNVTVTYSKDGAVLSTVKSNDSGIVTYVSNYDKLNVKITKSGYASGYEGGVNLSGSTASNGYRDVRLTPNNTIQVIYSDDESPASGIKVQLFMEDINNKRTILAKYTTGSNGYIGGTINDSYYTSGKIFLTCHPYSDNIWVLTSGNMKLKIPRTQVNPGEDDANEFALFNDFTVNAIKKRIDAGNVYFEGGDDYSIKILDPDSVTTLDIFTSVPVMQLDNRKSVIGSVDVSIKPDVNDLRLKVLNRYSGFYNPIFKDILFFNNLLGCPYSNTEFDEGYQDAYGKFGVINNLWFHKVNDNKDVDIINTLTPYYPLTGQYALDYRDYNIFESNWDINHFTRQVDINKSESCQNIASMKNGLCMFGSKYLNVPNRIEITGLTIGNDKEWQGEWNDDWITNPDGCPGEIMFKEVNDNSVDFYFFLTKRIQRFFADKLEEEFERYIDPSKDSIFSYGKPGLEDDIKEYVAKNVLKLYKLEKVRVFVRRTKKGQHNSKIENDYTTYLEWYEDPRTGEWKPIEASYFKKHGFVEVNTVTLTKMNRDDFDRKLVYNLRNGTKEEFGFGFILKKI